ncbi:putative PEP-binding protein [Spirochaeta africana]|uniref:Pyruvate, phosphate dikinase n=1 Tax=Spirochaeta africana (strain ATCC 700263 / DSM 8902 / Z-7692) TaxID=889378 RepID=H9UFI2_SPIAZ|nr:putative PEP-binding protein [Spirochaeta africana]AFG36275.1 phosphoenolpyruvate synthase/pyruvate phosphate dikinase [Spirochaeta africana DSM 8902]
MSMFISFGTGRSTVKGDQAIGSRGERAVSLAELDMPICPGFVIPNEGVKLCAADPRKAAQQLRHSVGEVEQVMRKDFGGEAPLLLKVVESPMLNVQSSLPSVHHIGLTETTVAAVAEMTGEKFAYGEYAFLLRSILQAALVGGTDGERARELHAYLEALKKAKTKNTILKAIEGHRDVLPVELYTDPYFQLLYVVQLFNAAFTQSPTTEDSAVQVQAMVYGNLDKRSSAGYLYTHHIVTGADELQGEFFPISFDETASNGKPINQIEPNHRKALGAMARKLEDHFREIRWIRFVIEADTLWLVDQASVPNKSAQAEIRTLLDLQKRDVVTKDYLIEKIKPGRLSEILHPTLDATSVKTLPTISGGIAGAVGAAIGRVFFTAESLITAYRQAQQAGEDTSMILAMPSTFAGDVKAIEIAQGVLSSEGGYASHAPVVARSLGKVAMVRPDAVFRKKTLVLDGHEVQEGDYITMNVPYYDDPVIYIGQGSLTKPSLEDSGLLEFMDIIQERIGDIDVHANADQPRDASLARKFNAMGIGLCRTEHMFFAESRINRFRYMILADDTEMRTRILDDLHKDQTEDFYELLKIMDGLPVTIRLLDAPLHEFLPHDEDGMKDFIAQAKKDGVGLTRAAILERSQLMREFNPMLGHRGIRVAISYPEIYRMQTRAIFEAGYKLKLEGKDPKPEIMIPLVMNPNELKVVRNGKKIEGKHILGIRDIEEQVRAKFACDPIKYSVGTMIELPAAALNSSSIARYADFFSFGTNDLTQTTYGISRDDFNTFFSDYTELDLLPNNPFKVLQPQVKELVKTAALRGRMVRPDLTLGLCGEHGAEPQNIDFIREAGLNYVSVSPYGIPIAKLAIAQMNLKSGE